MEFVYKLQSIFLFMSDNNIPVDLLSLGSSKNKSPARRPPTQEQIKAQKEKQKEANNQRSIAIKHHREIIQQRKKRIAEGKVTQSTPPPDQEFQLFYDPFMKASSPYSRSRCKEQILEGHTPSKRKSANSKKQQNILVETSQKSSMKQNIQDVKSKKQQDVKSNKTGKLQRSNKKLVQIEPKKKGQTQAQKFPRTPGPEIIDQIFKPINKNHYKLYKNKNQQVQEIKKNVESPKSERINATQKYYTTSQSAKKQTVQQFTTPKKTNPAQSQRKNSQQAKANFSEKKQVSPSIARKIQEPKPEIRKSNEQKESAAKPTPNSYQRTAKQETVTQSTVNQSNQVKQSQISSISNVTAKSDNKVEETTPAKPPHPYDLYKRNRNQASPHPSSPTEKFLHSVVTSNTLVNSKSQANVKVQQSKKTTSTQKFRQNTTTNRNEQSLGNSSIQKSDNLSKASSKGKHFTIQEARQNNTQSNLKIQEPKPEIRKSNEQKESAAKPTPNSYQRTAKQETVTQSTVNQSNQVKQSQISSISNVTAKSDNKVEETTPAKPPHPYDLYKRNRNQASPHPSSPTEKFLHSVVTSNTLVNSKSQANVKVQQSKKTTSTQKFRQNTTTNRNEQSLGNSSIQKSDNLSKASSKGKHFTIQEARQSNAQSNLKIQEPKPEIRKSNEQKESAVKPTPNSYQRTAKQETVTQSTANQSNQVKQSQISSISNVTAKSDNKVEETTPAKPPHPYDLYKRNRNQASPHPSSPTEKFLHSVVTSNTLVNSKSQANVKVQQSKKTTSTQKFRQNTTTNRNEQSLGNSSIQKSDNLSKASSKGKHCSIQEDRQNNAQTNLLNQSTKQVSTKHITSTKQAKTKYVISSALNNKSSNIDANIPLSKLNTDNRDDDKTNQLRKRIQELMKQNEIYISQTNRLKQELDNEKRTRAEINSNFQQSQHNIIQDIKVSAQNDILKKYIDLEDVYQSSRMQLQLAKNDVIRKKAMIQIANLEIIQRNRLIMELRYDQQARTPMMMQRLSQWTLQEGLHSYSRDPIGQIVKERRKRNREDCVNFRNSYMEEMNKGSRISFQSPDMRNNKEFSLVNFRSQKNLKFSRRDLFNSGERTLMTSGQRNLQISSATNNDSILERLQLRLKLMKRENELLKHRMRIIQQ